MKATELMEAAKLSPIMVGQFITSKGDEFPPKEGQKAQVVETFAVLCGGETRTFKRYVDKAADMNPHKLKLGDPCVVKLKIRERVVLGPDRKQQKCFAVGGEVEPLN